MTISVPVYISAQISSSVGNKLVGWLTGWLVSSAKRKTEGITQSNALQTRGDMAE